MSRGSARSPYADKEVPLVRVLCLGPVDPPHYWMSPGKYVRVCPRCRNLLNHAPALRSVYRTEQGFGFLAE